MSQPNDPRIAKAATEAERRTNNQAERRTCEGCRGTGVGRHRDASTETGVYNCTPCCSCAGYGVYFQVRDTTPALSVWELLGEPPPTCSRDSKPDRTTCPVCKGKGIHDGPPLNDPVDPDEAKKVQGPKRPRYLPHPCTNCKGTGRV